MRSTDGGVTGVVTDSHATAIVAATRKDATGRTRYHGQQKRGQLPKWKLNLQDMRHVREDFNTFEQAINMLATPEAQQMHKSDRQKAELATAAVGERMSRRTDDILERLGHFKQRHGKREGEE